MNGGRRKRGLPIGAYSSQPIGNLTVGRIDRAMKEVAGCVAYLRYCDDTVGLARTKAEARRQVLEFIRRSKEKGLVVKANFVVAPIGKEIQREKRRKRMRSKRSHHRLPGLSVHG